LATAKPAPPAAGHAGVALLLEGSKEMAIEIASRLLAVIAAVAFTLVFTTGRRP
jgi:hypothetical protein